MWENINLSEKSANEKSVIGPKTFFLVNQQIISMTPVGSKTLLPQL